MLSVVLRFYYLYAPSLATRARSEAQTKRRAKTRPCTQPPNTVQHPCLDHKHVPTEIRASLDARQRNGARSCETPQAVKGELATPQKSEAHAQKKAPFKVCHCQNQAPSTQHTHAAHGRSCASRRHGQTHCCMHIPMSHGWPSKERRKMKHNDAQAGLTVASQPGRLFCVCQAALSGASNGACAQP